MPLASFQHNLIELPISDRIVGDTVIKQKARFVSLEHGQTSTGTCQARIAVEISLYAVDATAADGYGPKITGAGFQPYTKLLNAANDTLVDLTSEVPGAILAVRAPNTSDGAWQRTIDSFPQTTMLQGDFFEMLRETQAIKIGDLVRQHILAADAMGRFAS